MIKPWYRHEIAVRTGILAVSATFLLGLFNGPGGTIRHPCGSLRTRFFLRALGPGGTSRIPESLTIDYKDAVLLQDG